MLTIRYQTIFAKHEGAVAAPTAGMHFSKHLLKRMEIKGINCAEITLHVGLGNFRTVDVEDLTKHKMDSEQVSIPEQAAEAINGAKLDGKKIVAVGTTVMRAIESSVSTGRMVKPFDGWTNKFIFHPYEFSVADAMISNLHLPHSTQLMMVVAFGGYDLMMSAYQTAIDEGYYLCAVSKNKILYVSSEIFPYLPESVMSTRGRTLSQSMQEYGSEIRTFMPRWGTINERRNQLHEVIRLSGMNLIIDDNDHQLIIKVASIPAARVQVYFIDNDDYFHRKSELMDDAGVLCPDNDERAIFFARGVLETVKKLRWEPSVVHCHGWFSAIVPIYLKGSFAEDPVFRSSKIVISLYNDAFGGTLDGAVRQKIENEGMKGPELQILDNPSYENLMKLVIDYADGVVIEEKLDNGNLIDYARRSGKPVLDWDGDRQSSQYMDVYHTFYDELLGK